MRRSSYQRGAGVGQSDIFTLSLYVTLEQTFVGRSRVFSSILEDCTDYGNSLAVGRLGWHLKCIFAPIIG